MDIYNQNKDKLLENVDLNLGYLKEDVKKIIHPEVKGVPEKGHYEVIKKYSNGGKDFKWIIDSPGIEAKKEHIEEKNILVFIPYSKEEIEMNKNVNEVNRLVSRLNQTDYVVIKMAESVILGEPIDLLKREYMEVLRFEDKTEKR